MVGEGSRTAILFLPDRRAQIIDERMLIVFQLFELRRLLTVAQAKDLKLPSLVLATRPQIPRPLASLILNWIHECRAWKFEGFSWQKLSTTVCVGKAVEPIPTNHRSNRKEPRSPFHSNRVSCHTLIPTTALSYLASEDGSSSFREVIFLRGSPEPHAKQLSHGRVSRTPQACN